MRLLTAVSGVQVPQQAPINIWHLLTNRCFSFYHPATAVPSVDAFSSKRYYGASAYGGYKSLASANKKLAPVIKQVFLFLSPQHCAIGKARFLADPLCGSQIQSALPLCRKAGFSAVKGILRNAITARVPTGVTSPWQAPIKICTC